MTIIVALELMPQRLLEKGASLKYYTAELTTLREKWNKKYSETYHFNQK